jgi:capsular exopolysaccharide synthesis family protein
MKASRTSVIDTFALETPYATEFRRLMHKVDLARSERGVKTILLTSAMLSEGKSTVCCFLGITSAVHSGLKTLLIDCDLRRPAIHKMFAVNRDRGMAEVLSEGFDLKDAIRKTSIDKLDIITCGRRHDEPTKLLDAETIGELIQQVKHDYDLVLIDAAPVLPVSDPMLLAPKVDALVLVVKAGSTQKDVVLRALDILGTNRRQVLGVVLNNMDSALPYEYDYRYYGYEYKGGPRRSEKVAARARNSAHKRNKKQSSSAQRDARDRTRRMTSK